MPSARLELATQGLGNLCSVRLSYEGTSIVFCRPRLYPGDGLCQAQITQPICQPRAIVLKSALVNGPRAQLAEQGTLNAKVRGSSPWRVISPSPPRDFCFSPLLNLQPFYTAFILGSRPDVKIQATCCDSIAAIAWSRI